MFGSAIGAGTMAMFLVCAGIMHLLQFLMDQV